MSETMTIKEFADFACEDGDGDAAVFAAAAHRFCEALETMDRHATVGDAALQVLAIHYGPDNLADHGIAVRTGPTGLNPEAVRFGIRQLMGGKAPDDLDNYSERRLRALMDALVPDRIHESVGDYAPGVDATIVKYCIYQVELGIDIEERTTSQGVAN